MTNDTLTHEQFNLVISGLCNRIQQHTVPIFRNENPEDRLSPPAQIGSGVLVEYMGRHFLASAGHVVTESKDGSNHIGVLVGNNAYIELGDSKYAYDTHQSLERLVDLGVWEIPTEFLNDFIGLTFFQLTDLNTENVDDPSALYICHGYPVRNTRVEIPSGDVRIDDFRILTQSVSNSRFSKRAIHNPDYNILLQFNRDKLESLSSGLRVSAPKPYGVSGGGVWKIYPNGSYMLAGILTEWKCPEEKLPLLMATKVDELIYLLSTFY